MRLQDTLTSVTINLYTVHVSNWNSNELYGEVFLRRKEGTHLEVIRECNQKNCKIFIKTVILHISTHFWYIKFVCNMSTDHNMIIMFLKINPAVQSYLVT